MGLGLRLRRRVRASLRGRLGFERVAVRMRTSAKTGRGKRWW